MTMTELLLIGLGGGIGSICRFLLSRLMHFLVPIVFPIGTLTVNVVGSFFVGFLFIFLSDRFVIIPAELRGLIMIGLIGGFTTFSTFSLEIIHIIQEGSWVKLFLHLFLSVGLGVLATFIGMIAARNQSIFH